MNTEKEIISQKVIQLLQSNQKANRDLALSLIESQGLRGCEWYHNLQVIAATAKNSIASDAISLFSAEFIDLSDKKLIELPKGISLLTYLKRLYLDKNNFTTFPDEIFMLNKLERLYLYSNKIKSIPVHIKKLESLNFIDLRFNNIPTEHISSLKKSLAQKVQIRH